MTIKEICEKFKDYVTIDRFRPVEMILYGFISLVLTALVVYGLNILLK